MWYRPHNFSLWFTLTHTMDTRIIVLVALCTLSAVSAKVCYPDQMQTAVLGKIGQVNGGQTQLLTMRGMEYGDFKKGMYSLLVDIGYEANLYKLRIVYDISKQKTYTINPDKSQCEVAAITNNPFKQYCEGDENFELVRSFSLGGQPAGIYRSNFSDMTSEITLMKKDFSPISSVIAQKTLGYPQLLARQFGNFSTKITHQGVFDVPSYCEHVEEEDHKNTDTLSRVCAPEQYEAEAFGTIGQVPSSLVMVLPLSVRQSRDYKNKIEASQTEVIYGGQKIRTVTVTDWKKGKEYVISKDKETCKVLDAPAKEMVEFCSDNPKLKPVAELTVNGRMATMYDTTVGPISSSTTVFTDSFEIISTVSEQEFSGFPQMIALQFGNMTKGIADRSVFNIPSYCNQ